jgi:hypothetical protein
MPTQTTPSQAPPARPQTKPSVEEPPEYMDWSEPIEAFEESAPMAPTRPRPQEARTPDARTPDARTPDAPPAIRAGGEIEAIIAELHRSKKAVIATAMEEARATEFHDDLLIFSFDSESVFSKKIRENTAVFRDIGARLLGRPLRIEVKISGQGDEPIDAAEVKKRELRQRVLQNPAISMVLEKTRGELLTIKENTPTTVNE